MQNSKIKDQGHNKGQGNNSCPALMKMNLNFKFYKGISKMLPKNKIIQKSRNMRSRSEKVGVRKYGYSCYAHNKMCYTKTE